VGVGDDLAYGSRMADIGDLLIPVAKDFSVLPVIGTIVALAILALAYGLKGKDVGEAVLPIAIGIAVVLFVFAWAAKPEAQQACRKLWNTSYNTIINPNSDFPEHAIPFAFDDDQCQLLVHCEPNRLC